MNGTSRRSSSYEFVPEYSNHGPLRPQPTNYHKHNGSLSFQQGLQTDNHCPTSSFYHQSIDNVQYLHDRQPFPQSIQRSATDYSNFEYLERIPLDVPLDDPIPLPSATDSVASQVSPDLGFTSETSMSSAGNYVSTSPSYLEDFVTTEPSSEESAHIDDYLTQYIKLEMISTPNEHRSEGLGIKSSTQSAQKRSSPKTNPPLVFKQEVISPTAKKMALPKLKPKPKTPRAPPKSANKMAKSLSTTQMATAAAAAAVSSQAAPKRKPSVSSLSSAAAIATTTMARNPADAQKTPVSARKSLPSTPKKASKSPSHSKQNSGSRFSFVFETAPKMPVNSSSACSLSSNSTVSSNLSASSPTHSMGSPTTIPHSINASSKPTFIIYSQQHQFIPETIPNYFRPHSRRNSIATSTSSGVTPLQSPMSSSMSKFPKAPTYSSSVSSVSISSTKYKKLAKTSHSKHVIDTDLKHNSEFQKSITKFPKNDVVPFEPKIYKDMRQGLMEFQLQVPPK
ncbi:hypothetical protein KL933_005049 [Ogataea haglerorum]|uniref:Uncharacterized protein n=1 Tax=Ogataea haglerorum TaxID=1937702 RepID=A0AAN6D197_9ASCO|nr:hypothetical protein KL933_005049 [Ogataea haglerorum]KAG7733510.1 hypothetical protein KL932_005110 [Ogataea haglerorum]KAG7736027.1 hypothetical protein KL923_005129 [Ogataea haglerorum]KAG7754248.1 hypothetical protein KL947_005058 [Ogataea haglerorum]KAG7762078.1 hypothetical protein KL946_004942 [Ogataea haglerorum]